jgi:hypothetical protein
MFLEPIHPADACIVEEDVDASVQINGGFDHVIHIVSVDNIHRDGNGFGAFLLQTLGESLQTVDTAGGKHQLATFGGKKPGGILAKARGCARDEDDFIFEGNGKKFITGCIVEAP